MVGVPAVAKHNPLARVNFYFALVSRELAGPISSVSGPLSFPSTPSLVRPLPSTPRLVRPFVWSWSTATLCPRVRGCVRIRLIFEGCVSSKVGFGQVLGWRQLTRQALGKHLQHE